MRDFNASEMAITGIPYQTSSLSETNFVQGSLSATLRPEYDTSVTPTSVDQTMFGYWFEDSIYSSKVTLSIVLALISGDAGQPGSVYECDFDPWYPINCAGFDDVCDEAQPNVHFTYDVITYFEYATGTTINFKVQDYLWVFIDGKLVVAITDITSSPSEVSINLDALTWINPPMGANPNIALVEGNPYSMSLFYVHRSLVDPMINWQTPGSSVCDAVSGANTTFAIQSFAGMNVQNSSIYDTQGGNGMVAIEGDRLRIASDSLLSSSAVYYAVGGVPQRFYVKDGFQTSFQFDIGLESSSAGAVKQIPGFAFVIQSQSSTARGGAAGGLGYEGIVNALAVEFDGIQVFAIFLF